ncbi:hypothetical protein ACS0TY_021782 [Phlomoides rotata]
MATGGIFPNGGSAPNGHHHINEVSSTKAACHEFQMPLHYPRYTKTDYEKMPEWQLDRLLTQYGLPLAGDLHRKREFAMGAFLWPHQL